LNDIRPYQGNDETQLLSVWHEAMTHDRVTPDVFRTKVLLDPNFQPEHLPVAVADGQVVGFMLGMTRRVPLASQGYEPERAWITAFGVRPEYRRRGAGEALLRHLLERFAADGRGTVAISPYVPNYFVPGVDPSTYPRTVSWLEQRGFRQTSLAISMGANLTGFQVPAAIVDLEARLRDEEGVRVQPVQAADLPDLMPFISKHFGWDWHRHASEYLTEYFGDTPQQTCFLVARQHGAVVGYCQQRRERFGPFGVDAEKRSLGIGRVLLFRCLEAMSARHVFFSYFLWTGEDAARLYERAGFERRRTFALLERDLP
jgi:ribosomal protein S18 acetylase RimI-like enzyme